MGTSRCRGLNIAIFSALNENPRLINVMYNRSAARVKNRATHAPGRGDAETRRDGDAVVIHAPFCERCTVKCALGARWCMS